MVMTMMMLIKMTVVLVDNVDYELLTISFPRSSEFEEEEGDLVIDESMVGDLAKKYSNRRYDVFPDIMYTFIILVTTIFKGKHTISNVIII